MWKWAWPYEIRWKVLGKLCWDVDITCCYLRLLSHTHTHTHSNVHMHAQAHTYVCAHTCKYTVVDHTIHRVWFPIHWCHEVLCRPRHVLALQKYLLSTVKQLLKSRDYTILESTNFPLVVTFCTLITLDIGSMSGSVADGCFHEQSRGLVEGGFSLSPETSSFFYFYLKDIAPILCLLVLT